MHGIDDLLNKQAPAPPLRRGSGSRALIQTAKRRLMELQSIDEQAAHRQLQKLSMDSGKPMVDVARMVLRVL